MFEVINILVNNITMVKSKTKKGNYPIEDTLRQVGKSNAFFDKRLTAKKPGKRTAEMSGNVYYEYRANRSDKNQKKRL